MHAKRTWIAMAVAGLAAACGGSSTGPSNGTNGGGGGGANAVSIGDYYFSPSTITVKAGASVAFTNYGAATHHPVADNGSFDAGDLGPAQSGAYGAGSGVGGSASVTFSNAGTVSYHCSIHPNMTGTVTVTP